MEQEDTASAAAPIPETPQGVAVDPDRALSPTTRIEKSVAMSRQIELAAIERGRRRRRLFVLRKLQLREIVHRQRKNLPARQFVACEQLPTR